MYEPGVQSSVNQGYAGNVEVEVNPSQQYRPPSAGYASSKPVSYGLSSCSLFSALTVLVFGALCLWDETKDGNYFNQNITIVTSIGGWYAVTGGYSTRFGWEQICIKYDGAGDWTCTKYNQIDGSQLDIADYDFEYTGALKTLGKMSYVYSALCVAFSSIFLLGVCGQARRLGGPSPNFFNSFNCIGILMWMYGFCVVIISFPVMAKKFLDSVEKETNIEVNNWLNVGWAWTLTFINSMVWLWLGNTGKQGSAGMY